MRLFAILILVALLLGEQSLDRGRAATAATPAADGDFAGLVDIGDGRRLWLECRGSGSPTVVLEAGYPNRGDVWDAGALDPASGATAVMPGASAFTRVCSYDRPGTVLDADRRSRSDPVPQPRTAADVVADLHALLGAAGVPGPYVLVGHSIGGLFARLYASTYPDGVAGLVLVDSSHEDQNELFQAALSPEQWAAFEEFQQQAAMVGQEDYPELERIDFEASFAEMRTAAAATPLRSVPLVVLSHGRPLGDGIPADVLPGFQWDLLERAGQDLQNELAALVPGARHVTATESGHYIQIEQPDLVVDAIGQVVSAVRDPSRWATPAA